MSRSERQTVLDWAAGSLAMGDAPPWASFDYMKLRETLEAIVSGMEAATQSEVPPPLEPQPESNLEPVTIAEPDSAEPGISEPPADL
jgi:hypothetical protein